MSTPRYAGTGARELDQAFDARGKPLMIVSDNDTEPTSHALLRWQERRGARMRDTAPGEPK